MHGAQPIARCNQRIEHGAIERIELVGTIEPNVGHSLVDGDLNPRVVGC